MKKTFWLRRRNSCYHLYSSFRAAFEGVYPLDRFCIEDWESTTGIVLKPKDNYPETLEITIDIQVIVKHSLKPSAETRELTSPA